MSKIDYERVLNPAQRKAVMTVDGPVLVIAGAGSGKTRTLVYRVARLVEMGVHPESILLLTFTRKAAGEMLERAAGLADDRCKNVSGGTFHSLAHRVLRANAGLLGFETNFTILDRSDMEEAVQALVRDMQIDRGGIRFPKRSTMASILSKAANLQVSVETLLRDEYAQFLEYLPYVDRLATLYRTYKRENQLMDYDDLIIFFRQLLSERVEIRKQLGERYRYVMVDEYQDTNGIQADIVKWLADSHNNIMVVGDDSQSIYSFRGANYRNMFDFPHLFPDAKVIKLEENYRSTQPILTFTNSLMDQAQEKYTKCLYTQRGDGVLPRAVDTRTEPEQALFISRSLRDHLSQGRSLKEIAVLFRAGHHSFELEVELARQGIPFVKYGGFRFTESAHIKDLLAHLRVVINGDDIISWGRILRLIRNIGQGKSQAIINWMKEGKRSPWEVGEWPRARKADRGLGTLTELMRQISTKGATPARAVELVMEYYDPILKKQFDDFPRRQKDLGQLVTMASRYRSTKSFLDDLMLEPPTSTADLEQTSIGDRLTLSTVHSAKGLEWAQVYIIWVMEGYFPSARANANSDAIEEERRLMYVAATRAKDELTLCYPSQEAPKVWQFGDSGYRHGLSSFIEALPNDVMERDFSRSPGRLPSIQWTKEQPSETINAPVAPSGLRPGDRVKHPAFGPGVISKFIDKEKVEVLFRNVGRKLLHLGYTTLERM